MNYSSADYKSFLDPQIISKFTNLELKARLVVEGFMVGLHRSPYHGFSVEFSEHRPYMQGDDLKNVDWKVYGKTEEYFIKQFEEETNLKSYIILDTSRSMDFKSANNISKLNYSIILAAALAYIMIRQQDSVGLALYSEKINKIMPPKASRAYLQEILKNLSSVSSGQKTHTAESLDELAEKIKRRGLVIIISDFFDEVDKVIKSIKKFSFKKNEVIIFQILDPLEKSFAFGKDAVFRDLETAEEITTQPFQIQKAYQEAMEEFTSKIKRECLNSKFDYNLIETSQPFDKALLSFVQKRSKLH